MTRTIDTRPSDFLVLLNANLELQQRHRIDEPGVVASDIGTREADRMVTGSEDHRVRSEVTERN